MQQVWIPQRNLVFISLSHHCEGILSHFSLQHSCSSFRLWAILYAGPFTEFQSGRFFCCAWDHCPVAWSIFVQDGLIFDYNTLVHIGVFDWLNGFKVPRSCGCKPNLNHHPSHHCVLRLQWGFCGYAVFGFSKCGAVHYDQMSPLWSCLSRSLIVSSDATLLRPCCHSLYCHEL